MSQNPALRELGFSPDDRVVVVHADDVGMCGATVDAFFDLVDDGLTSSGSVMVPCPWFPSVAARARGRTDVDIGIHLTLTSEWDDYRWGPLSTRDPRSGLIDEEGYFFRNQSLWTALQPEAARAEMEAQVDRALAAGLDVTHLDCHMFAMLHPALIEHYVDMAFSHRVPALMTRQPQWVAALSEAAIAGWEDRGLPVFDHLREMPLDAPVDGLLDTTMRLFAALPPGLTYLITHPARDTPELRAVAADWRPRVADGEVFADDGLADSVRKAGVHVLGWRPLRGLLRRRCVPA
jgi:chitin disaccharide deacetylase